MEEWIEKKAVEFLWKNENYILHNLNEMKYNHQTIIGDYVAICMYKLPCVAGRNRYAWALVKSSASTKQENCLALVEF